MTWRFGGLLTIPKHAITEYATRTVRICSIPLLVLALTGWIPAQYDSTMAWPWVAIAGFSLMLIALIGLFRPIMETLCVEVEKSEESDRFSRGGCVREKE